MLRDSVASGSPYEESIGFRRGVRLGGTIAISGTAPVWPDGHVDPDVGAQAHRCWEIALRAVEKLGGTRHDVVRTRQYIVSPDDAAVVGRVHGEVFGTVLPASTMVVVAGLLNPLWRVEVELDAVVD